MAGLLGAGVFPSTRAFGNRTVSAALHWDHNQLLVNPNAASSPEGENLDTSIPAVQSPVLPFSPALRTIRYVSGTLTEAHAMRCLPAMPQSFPALASESASSLEMQPAGSTFSRLE